MSERHQSGGREDKASPPAPRRRWPWVIAGVLGLGVLVIPLFGLRITSGSGTGPADYPALQEAWTQCLAGAVAEGVVDYGELSRRGCVAPIVAALDRIGPRSTPVAFTDRATRLSYYINAYNILAVHGILAHDLRDSVHELRGWWAPDPGMGFFWSQRFWLDGSLISLHGLENDLLRPVFRDARVHAAINCASGSCPQLLDRAYRSAHLEEDLDAAARRFASDAPHVRIHAERIELSSIYQWYVQDFAADASSPGEEGALDWIEAHADAETADALRAARTDHFEVHYVPYDWSLNGHW